MRPWDNIISDEEQRAYRAAGFGRPGGIGSRPALLIIDVQYRTVGTQPRPFWEAIKEFPTSCGEVGWHAVANIRLLLAEFRKRKWPVLYPHVAPKKPTDGGRLAQKVPAIMNIAARGYDFVEDVAPREGDIRLPKKPFSPRRSSATSSTSARIRWWSPAAPRAAACARASSTPSRTTSACSLPRTRSTTVARCRTP